MTVNVLYGRVLCRNSTNISAMNFQSETGTFSLVTLQGFLDQKLINIKWRAMCCFIHFYSNRKLTDKVLA